MASHLSFTKATQELFVTQPAVTQHVHELEKQYGQRLLARQPHGSHRGGLLAPGPPHAEAVAAQQPASQLLALRTRGAG